MHSGIEPLRQAEKLRNKLINIEKKQILISKLSGSQQEADIKAGINCLGYGRLRTTAPFSEKWPFNTNVPNEPAIAKLKISKEESELSQLFQVAGCNLRCWFCYVDTKLLVGKESQANFFTADELVDLLVKDGSGAKIITLTGGQPDIVPEWLPWMMKSLIKFRVEDRYYLWMDDNLTTDFAWRFLKSTDWDFIRSYKNFGKVACLKSFCEAGFYENTGANKDYFEYQINIFKKLSKAGIDLYGYLILTIADINESKNLPRFMDRLQREIHENILLRITPLEIKLYTPTVFRMSKEREASLKNQYRVIEIWMNEINKRYNSELLNISQCNVPMD